MKILITGINGFVGANFTNSWSKNHTLFGLDIKLPSNIYSVIINRCCKNNLFWL